MQITVFTTVSKVSATVCDVRIGHERREARDEANNARTVEKDVAPAPRVNLVIENLALDPDGGYLPGQTVDVTWITANRGSQAVTSA
jgi:hypothetical protein